MVTKGAERMHKPTNADAVRMLARSFRERAEAQRMTGKRRDTAALEFFAGAIGLAHNAGDALLGEHLARVAVLVVAVRGYRGLVEIAEEPLSIEIAATAHRVGPVMHGAH